MLKIWICSPLNHIFLNFPNYELRFSKDILFQIFRNIWNLLPLFLTNKSIVPPLLLPQISKMYQISNSISSSFESRDKNRHEVSTVLFHSRMKKSNEKRELRDRGKTRRATRRWKTRISFPARQQRLGRFLIIAVASIARLDSRGEIKRGREEGAPRSSERKVRIRGVGESHTGHRTGTIFFRCPLPAIFLKTDPWPEVTHRLRDSRGNEISATPP